MNRVTFARLIAWNKYIWLAFVFLAWLIMDDDERDALKAEFKR